MVAHDWGEFAFAPPEARQGSLIRLPDAEAHHLQRVRRVRGGEHVFVSDGAGMVYECVVRDRQELQIIAEHPGRGEPRQRILVAAAVLKGNATAALVDAATQLGAAEIILFRAEHSVANVSAAKIARLQRVALSAMKQCGRAVVPPVRKEDSLDAVLDSFFGQPAESRLCIVAHPAETGVETMLFSKVKGGTWMLVVGPEGGFSERELETVRAAGCHFLDLGVRRMRAEMAVAVALAILRRECGEAGSFWVAEKH